MSDTVNPAGNPLVLIDHEMKPPTKQDIRIAMPPPDRETAIRGLTQADHESPPTKD